MKLLLRGVIRPKSEDGGQALIAEIAEDEIEVFVRLQSWDETKKHPTLSPLVGKYVQITVEEYFDSDGRSLENWVRDAHRNMTENGGGFTTPLAEAIDMATYDADLENINVEDIRFYIERIFAEEGRPTGF